MKRTYTVWITPCETGEGGYWVKVPTLPGCVSEGETVDEALSNAKEAIEGYILALIDLDQEIPVPDERLVAGSMVATVSVEV